MRLIKIAQNVEYLTKIGVPLTAAPDLLAFIKACDKEDLRWFLRKIKENPGLDLESYKEIYRRTKASHSVDPAIKSWAEKISSSYSEWLINALLGGRIRMGEDDNKLRSLLKTFEVAVKQGTLPPDRRDINKLKDDKDLYDALHSLMISSDILIPEDNPNLIYNQDGVQILVVTDPSIATKYANNTNWCVKYPDTAKFYLKKGPLHFVFVDFKKAVLIHVASEQIKETNDAPLKNYSIIKRLHPVLEQLGLVIDSGDYQLYLTVLEEGRSVNSAMEMALEKSNESPSEAIKSLYPDIEDLERVVLYLEENYFEDSSIKQLCSQIFIPKIRTLGQSDFVELYKTLPRNIQLIPDILEICKDKFVKAIKDSPGFYSDCSADLKKHSEIQEARFDGYKTLLIKSPELFDTEDFPEEYRQSPIMRECRHQGWIKKILSEPRSFKNIPVDLEKDEKISKSRIEGWVRAIHSDPSQYDDCPDLLQSLPEIETAGWESTVEAIEANPRNVNVCPEYFLHMPEIMDLAIRKWISAIKKSYLMWKYCPQEIRENPLVQNAYRDVMANKIRHDVNLMEELEGEDRTMLSSDKIQQAFVDSWVNRIEDRLEDYKIVPPDIKQNQAIQDAALHGWVKRVEANPYQINFVPPEFKKRQEIRDAINKRNPFMRPKASVVGNWYRLAVIKENL